MGGRGGNYLATKISSEIESDTISLLGCMMFLLSGICSYIFCIRSHGNSRGVNSREVRGFFGHSSESTGWILTKIGGNCSYRPPGAF